MSEKGQFRKIRVKKNDDRLGFNWFFWICFVIILIPFIYFGILLIQASQETHNPIVGTRITSSVSNPISDGQVQEVQEAVKTIPEVESCTATKIVATLRLTVDASDDLTNDQYKEIAVKVYDKVNEILPIKKYFTIDGDFKQYDLEIDVYDSVTSQQPIQICLEKNSSMEEYKISDYSTALNPELVEELTNTQEEQ